MSDMSEAEENVSVPTDNDLPQENPQPAQLEPMKQVPKQVLQEKPVVDG
jgi:hypothetical protein